MSTKAAKFFVEWFEKHISSPGAVQGQDVAQLAALCLAEATEAGIPREDIQVVAGDISESIRDEIEYVAVLKSMSPCP